LNRNSFKTELKTSVFSLLICFLYKLDIQVFFSKKRIQKMKIFYLTVFRHTSETQNLLPVDLKCHWSINRFAGLGD